MSQSHIPQPDASAPGEQIQSTDSVLPMRSIEVTQPSFSEEIGSALGELNGIDPFYYSQFRQIAKLRWTVQDVAGKCLWYVPLNPLSMDKNLAYLARMYLAWDGDFVFNFKVAGTGFHAGLLTFVKTPPTIHPLEITNPQDFTYMPWDAVDPKMLEIGSLYGRDIRPIKYHYVQKSEKMPPDYYIGGYLALFVDIPLNTSASGTPRIEIAVWVKCAPNFRFGWMVPYDLQTVVETSQAPPAIEYAVQFNRHTNVLASYPIETDKLVIMPKATKVLNTGMYNCFATNGTKLSRLYPTDDVVFIPPNFEFRGIWNGSGNNLELKDCYPYWQGLIEGEFALYSEKTSAAGLYKNMTMSDKLLIKATGTLSGPEPSNTDGCTLSLKQDAKPSTISDVQLAAKVQGESFLVFQGNGNVYSIQTSFLSSVFYAKEALNWIGAGNSAIFQMVEADTKLPLTYVKMYKEGFFTVPGNDNQVIFNLNNILFKFAFFLPETDPIPSNDNINNFRLAAIFHAKARLSVPRN